jgi:hypothetical protein
MACLSVRLRRRRRRLLLAATLGKAAALIIMAPFMLQGSSHNGHQLLPVVVVVHGWQISSPLLPPPPRRQRFVGPSADTLNESTMKCTSSNNDEIVFADQQLSPPPLSSQHCLHSSTNRVVATTTDTFLHSRLRRAVLKQATESMAQALLVGGTAWSASFHPARASAVVVVVVEPVAPPPSAALSSNEQVNALLQKLHDIPTFCIVRSDTGAAYMAYQSDLNMAIGYAFATFPGALAVLKDAQSAAQQKGYFETWEMATITTIPLDIAVRLALKKRSRTSQKSQSLDTLLQVIPGAVRTNVVV